MIYGLYQSAAGMMVNQYRQNVLANNLANADTVGFKRDIAALIERSAVESARDWLKSRVKGLEQRLALLKESQETLLVRVTEKTVRDIDRVERLIAKTGLDAEDLLKRANADSYGQGGPFVPFGVDGEAGAFAIGLAVFDRRLARWDDLRKLLRTLPLVAPLDHYRLASGFGRRRDPINRKLALHEGLDLAAEMRAPVYATAPGRVVFAGWKGRFGRLIEIDHGLGIRTRYGHLRRIDVKRGQRVSFGQIIGQLGNSGRSTGPHVHYEIMIDGKPVDPAKFMKAGRDVFKG